MPPKKARNTVKASNMVASSATVLSKRGLSAQVLQITQTPRETRSSRQKINIDPLKSFNKPIREVPVILQRNHQLPSVREEEHSDCLTPKGIPASKGGIHVQPKVYKTSVESLEDDIDEKDENSDNHPDLYETASEEGETAMDHAWFQPPSLSDTSSGIEEFVFQQRTGRHKLKKNTTDQLNLANSTAFEVTIWFVFQRREVLVAVESTDDYVAVKRALGLAIGIEARDLRPLQYKIEKDRNQSAFRDFNSQRDWEHIITWARKYRQYQLNRKNGTPNEWSVRIREASGSKAGFKAGSTSHDRKKNIENMSKIINAPRLQASKELAQARQCNQHGGKYCWVPCGGDTAALTSYGINLKANLHIQITDSEFEMWLDEVLANNATVRSPGTLLARQIARRYSQMLAKKAELSQPVPSATNSFETPRFARTFTALGPPTPQRFLARSQSVPISGELGPSESNRRRPIGSGKRHIPINEWLASLRGRIEGDNTNYQALLQPLLAEDIQSTLEICLLGKEGLVGIGGIAKGTAARLEAWAREDTG